MQKMNEKEAKDIIYILAMSRAEEGDEEDCEALDIAMNSIEEIQQYRAIENDLREKYNANVDIKGLIEYFIETIFKGDKHEGFCILTNEDAKMWDEYQAIGTPDQCREAVERMKPKKLDIEARSVGEYLCGNCYEPIPRWDTRYCPNCGHAIDRSE